MLSYLALFIGGGFGTIVRFLFSKYFNFTFLLFPVGTFLANTISCLILGFFMGLEMKCAFSNDYKLLLLTGFCGGFSTFSTFTAENLQLLKSNEYLSFITYTFSSLIVCLIFMVIGYYVAKLL